MFAANGLSGFKGKVIYEILNEPNGGWNDPNNLESSKTPGQEFSDLVNATATAIHATNNSLSTPADVLVMPDGSLLVSDDFAGAIYRITYRN